MQEVGSFTPFLPLRGIFLWKILWFALGNRMSHAVEGGAGESRQGGGNFDKRHVRVSVHPLYILFPTPLLQHECLESWVPVFGRYLHPGRLGGDQVITQI